MRLLTEFIYLQVLDVLTTLAFLMQGVTEANPVVRWAIEQSPGPLPALLAVKAVALSLALFCVYQARHALLHKVNVFFALLVAYNLIVLIVVSPPLG